MFEFFNKKESAVPDINRLEALAPNFERFKNLLSKAENIEDFEELKTKMFEVEREFELLCAEVKTTAHGEQYFREKDKINRDSLETSERMIPYLHTPLEGFEMIEKRLEILRRRLENSLHDDKYSD